MLDIPNVYDSTGLLIFFSRGRRLCSGGHLEMTAEGCSYVTRGRYTI